MNTTININLTTEIKMKWFLKKHKYPNLPNMKDYVNILITIKSTKYAFLNFTKGNLQAQLVSTKNVPNIKVVLVLILYNIFQKTEEDCTFLNFFCEATTTVIEKTLQNTRKLQISI